MSCVEDSVVPLSADLLSGETHDLGPESDEQTMGACSPHDRLVPVFWCADVDGWTVFIPKKQTRYRNQFFKSQLIMNI
jgi:hypothetical protein